MTSEQIKERRDWLDTLTGYTPGPWKVQYIRGTTQMMAPNGESLMCDETYYPWVPESLNDWELIAAAPDLRDRYAAALDEIERLRDALEIAVGYIEGVLEYGCPKCSGDCSSANPPTAFCPMREAHNDLTTFRIALKGKDQ